MVQAFASTGPPPFMGQGDPIRFSFNPKHWLWSLEEWSPASVSLRGRWATEKPDTATVPADSGAGPLANLPVVPIKEQKRIMPALRGTVTDLAYDAGTDRFFLATQHGIYIIDGSLTRVLRYTVVDPGFSVDLGRFAGAAFLDSTTLMAVGENKSYVILRENDQADPDRNFRFFLESFDKFDELSRSRFATVRGRMMYVMSLAFDPVTNSLYTVTVPNSKVKRLVVSRFDRRDLLLSAEFVPALAPESGLKLSGERRSLDEFFVTGATIADGRMYAISAAYDTLVLIDLATHSIVAAYAVPGLVRPTGIAVKSDELYISGGDGTVFVIARPNR
jgi:disulfide bond formation protein DsbB